MICRMDLKMSLLSCRIVQLMACAALLLPHGLSAQAQAEAADRPNVLLIMADDLGFADLGSYGGEIDTPNLDRLAAEGVRFSQFRVAPMCTVSRVALLSGLPFNGGGDGQYSQTAPLPAVLKQAGYHTAMTGKWHAGSGPADPRSPELFDQFFGFLGGMTDSFVGGNDWFRNQQKFNNFPDDFYSTDAFADTGIDFIRSAPADNPWLLFVSFNAPHHPCQAPQATFKKYRERYRAGYRSIRDQRLARQRELGLIDAEMTPAEPGVEVRRWEELPEPRQLIEADRMAAYAAAVDELDQAVGRLLDYLDQTGQAEHTLVAFFSDNGGDYSNGSPDTDAQQKPWLPGANPTSSNGWAWVKNTPFRSYKHASYEGALASPLIVRWPARQTVQPGSIIREPAFISDLYPTLLELAGAEYPTQFQGRSLAPLAGSSLLPLLIETDTKRRRLPTFTWYETSRSWIEDPWKAVQLYGGPWELYDLRHDRGETSNLASQQPARLEELVRRWNERAEPSLREPMTASHDAPVHGWGWHRIRRITGEHLTALSPANGQFTDGLPTTLELTFDANVTFPADGQRAIRLYKVAEENTPLWQASPGPDHPSQGTQTIRFDDLPTLEPDTSYFVRWDPGWFSVAGQPVGPLNDGAYWWRFRTPAEH